MYYHYMVLFAVCSGVKDFLVMELKLAIKAAFLQSWSDVVSCSRTYLC